MQPEQSPNLSGSRAPKRSRSENWAEQDKMILKKLVNVKIHLIENKNTDHNTNRQKTEAWKELRDRFNTMSIAPRSVSQLKAQWCLMKMNKKKQKYSECNERFRTTGGPPPLTNDPLASEPIKGENISTWLTEEFDVDSNQFDSEIDEAVIADKEVSGNNDEMSVKMDETPQNKNTRKKNQVKKSSGSRSTPTEKIAENEVKCRTELHKVQLSNEEQKRINLQLEERLLQLQILYYEKKLNLK